MGPLPNVIILREERKVKTNLVFPSISAEDIMNLVRDFEDLWQKHVRFKIPCLDSYNFHFIEKC